jgi:sensor histidine kinase YesM
MDRFPFIFSDDKKYRIRRHVTFWVFWWISQGFLYSFVALGDPGFYYRLRLESSMLESLVYLIPHMLLSYSIIYYVIPELLLKQKYWRTAFLVILLFLLTALISSVLSLTVIELIRTSIIGYLYGLPKPFTKGTVFLSLMAGLRGGISIVGIASAIKLMKYWYIKEQRNIQLEKENIASQLQLLKAQVHPHFLFNTLNNIYSYTQKVSPTGSALVMGLSDLLRYILHEGSKQRVPLPKELKMIDDYIMLEQIRYGSRLEISKEISADTEGLVIAPLLLLPFIENCFKHGTSHMLEQAWIRLSIKTEKNILKLTLVNAKMKDPEKTREMTSGIGIINVRKRLDLIYPGKYELLITEEEDVFIVNLRVELETIFIPFYEKEIAEKMIHA